MHPVFYISEILDNILRSATLQEGFGESEIFLLQDYPKWGEYYKGEALVAAGLTCHIWHETAMDINFHSIRVERLLHVLAARGALKCEQLEQPWLDVFVCGYFRCCFLSS